MAIPRKGKPGEARQATNIDERSADTVKWRTGIEGRISTLKRGYGWDRARIDASKVPGSGPATASWPTTCSRSAALAT